LKKNIRGSDMALSGEISRNRLRWCVPSLIGVLVADRLASESAAVLQAAQALSSAEGETPLVMPQGQAMAAHA
jgi:hypothetical protein